LHSALRYWTTEAGGGVEMITALVNAGADVRATDNGGKNALHYAAGSPSDSSALMSKLIDLGADPNATDQDGNTPLHFAVPTLTYEESDPDCRPKVVALVKSGAKINALNKAGETPMSSEFHARNDLATGGRFYHVLKMPNWLRELGAKYSDEIH
jgi:ankyrin repeat protein